jgi:hypothetical protein
MRCLRAFVFGHWRARRRADAVINALYPPAWASVVPRRQPAAKVTAQGSELATGIPRARGAEPRQRVAIENVPSQGNELAAGIPRARGAEPISPNSVTPQDGIIAIDYLRFCWGDKVLQDIITAHAIPSTILDEARRRCEERRENIDLAGRTLHIWEGKDISADTRALSDAIVTSGARLFRVDHSLVRLAAPISDEATAGRIRKLYGYAGPPGQPGDPALHAGERFVPILPSDSEALREIIAKHVATKRHVNYGTKSDPDWREEIGSFGFKSTVNVHVEPDAQILKDLLKRALVTQIPEVLGVITAPTMPNLPASTKPTDLTYSEADRIIAAPGFDTASGLYLSPLGTIVDVPETPTPVREAADLLLMPWADFPFASPGENLDPEVSRRRLCVRHDAGRK